MIYKTNRAACANAKSAGWKWLIVLSLCGACDLLRAATPESMPDGSYRVSCTSALNQCLASLDNVCLDGYDVIRAQEKRERRGPSDAVRETISSEALVRCRTPEALFSFSAKSARDSASVSAADSAPPDGATVPEASGAATTSAAATTPPAVTTPDAAPE